jgi:hypothetical protein
VAGPGFDLRRYSVISKTPEVGLVAVPAKASLDANSSVGRMISRRRSLRTDCWRRHGKVWAPLKPLSSKLAVPEGVRDSFLSVEAEPCFVAPPPY